jgi:hypothetical protein
MTIVSASKNAMISYASNFQQCSLVNVTSSSILPNNFKFSWSSDFMVDTLITSYVRKATEPRQKNLKVLKLKIQKDYSSQGRCEGSWILIDGESGTRQSHLKSYFSRLLAWDVVVASN